MSLSSPVTLGTVPSASHAACSRARLRLSGIPASTLLPGTRASAAATSTRLPPGPTATAAALSGMIASRFLCASRPDEPIMARISRKRTAPSHPRWPRLRSPGSAEPSVSTAMPRAYWSPWVESSRRNVRKLCKGENMAAPSPGYSITVRVEAPTDAAATARLSSVVAEAGGAITALDVADVSCNASDVEHSESITKAIAAMDGFSVRKVSDRTFLLHLGGKIEVTPKVPLKHRDDLSRAYTPGVARVCLAIAENPADARRLTIKRNTVAVVTDGSAVLGLGNIGPAAALPVMEGKAALFKRFAGVDAWPVCLDTQDSDKIVEIVKAIAPVYGGVNLEDISAPRCFEIEERLRAELDIPVFHDDQHGTAIVVLAALINALRVVDKKITDAKIVISGAGAAGHAIVQLLDAQGAGHIIAYDRKGALHT